jgi:hypothetical protein
MTLKIEKVDDGLFREVKAQATLEGATLREYVIEALTVALAKSKQKAGKR